MSRLLIGLIAVSVAALFSAPALAKDGPDHGLLPRDTGGMGLLLKEGPDHDLLPRGGGGMGLLPREGGGHGLVARDGPGHG